MWLNKERESELNLEESFRRCEGRAAFVLRPIEA
jgi:hypothetical protein